MVLLLLLILGSGVGGAAILLGFVVLGVVPVFVPAPMADDEEEDEGAYRCCGGPEG